MVHALHELSLKSHFCRRSTHKLGLCWEPDNGAVGGSTLELQGRDNISPSRCPGSAHSPAAELSTQLSHSHRLHKSLSQLPICEQTKLSRREKPTHRPSPCGRWSWMGHLDSHCWRLSIAPRDSYISAASVRSSSTQDEALFGK